MTTALMIITLALAAVHITACSRDMRALRTWTKPFLVPMMGLTFFYAVHKMGLSMPFWPAVLAALAFYTLGDVLLIPMSRKGFLEAGMVSFIFGHVCFAWIFTRGGVSGLSLMIWAVLWCTAYFFIEMPQLRWTEKDSKKYGIYAAMIMLFGIAAGGGTYGGNTWAHVAAVSGVVVFAFSDSLIQYEQTKKTDMSAVVMMTYISAVALLLASAFALGV